VKYDDELDDGTWSQPAQAAECVNVRKTPMKTDTHLYQDVLREFTWDARLEPNEIIISVKEGVVILTGCTDSANKKCAAEQVAKRIAGVRGVVNDVQMCASGARVRTDADIAHAAIHALERCVNLPLDRVKVVVCNGWVTLEGVVDRYDQCEDAEEVVRELIGLQGVTNLIIVRPSVAPQYIQAQIAEAFQRSAEIDARFIAVEVSGSKVILRGQVRSWAEGAAAWRLAWRASGVTSIENLIEVTP
jgi:osmotically-inducible protein OsmY